MSDQRFGPEYRIRRSADFRRALRLRCAVSNGQVTVFGARNGLPHPRLGISVSRKVGGAVVRNRWKRLLREAFRLDAEKLPRGMDLVVVPRAGVEPELSELASSLLHLAEKLSGRVIGSR